MTHLPSPRPAVVTGLWLTALSTAFLVAAPPGAAQPGPTPPPARTPSAGPPPVPRLDDVTVEPVASTYRAAPGGTSGRFATGQAADLMLSGIDFDETGGGLLFNHPSGLASDGTQLLLADRNNNRVLIWRQPPAGNAPPDVVLGQPDFTSNAPGTGRDGLNWPCAVAAGPNGRLAVADTNNDRLLLWSRIPTNHRTPADVMLRLPALGRTTMPFGWPWGVWTDGERLVATATHGGAILIWHRWPASDDQMPDLVVADPALGTPRAIVSDGQSLIVDDHNAKLPASTPPPGAPGGGAPHGLATFFWRAFPTAAGARHDFSVQGVRLRGGHVDGKLVLLGDRTMRIFDGVPATAAAATAPALTVPGPWSSDGVALAVAGGRLYTMDENDNRIRAYDRLPDRPDAAPAFVIGAEDTIVHPLASHFIMTNPVPASDGRALYVSSDFDRTLHVWRDRPDESGAHPDWVYHLPIGAWDNVIWRDQLILAGGHGLLAWSKLPRDGERPDVLVSSPIGGLPLRQIRGVTRDDDHVYLADYETGTVYVFDDLPTDGRPPRLTLTPGGRPSRLASDGAYLAVCVEGTGAPGGPPGANRSGVVLYRVADLAAGVTSPAAVVTAPGLNLPQGVHLAGGGLYVADTSNHRVAVWRAIDDAIAGAAPDALLGARDADDRLAEIGRAALFMPGDVWFDGDYLWVGEFKFANRLLRFSPGGPAGMPTATATATSGPAAPTATPVVEPTPAGAAHLWLPWLRR